MKVEKWGDDLAIRLPAEIVEILDLKEGDEVDIRVSGPDTFDIEKHGGRSGRKCARCVPPPPTSSRRREGLKGPSGPRPGPMHLEASSRLGRCATRDPRSRRP